LENFDACQQYFKQILLAHKARKGGTATVAAVNTNNHRPNPSQSGNKSNKNQKTLSLTKHYNAEE
jgi:hypothetical protein